MKDQILKIAGVKSEKEFYKKYPTEESFMAKHGKKLEKAAMGKAMVNKQLKQLTDFGNPPIAQSGKYIPVAFNDLLTNAKAISSGITKEEQIKRDSLEDIAKQDEQPDPLGGIGDIISQGIEMFGGGDDDGTAPSSVTSAAGEFGSGKSTRLGSLMGFGENGIEIPEAQFGLNNIAAGLKGIGAKSGGLGNLIGNQFGGDKGVEGIMGAGKNVFSGGLKSGLKNLGTKGGASAFGKAAGVGLLNSAGDIIGGIGQMQEQKKAIDKANQQAQLTGVTAQAAESKQVGVQKHNFVRPEQALVQPDQLGSAQGVGSDFLQMQSGGEIQNTYAPGTLYDDLEYIPQQGSIAANAAYQSKSQNVQSLGRGRFKNGGEIPTAEFGDYFQSSGQASIGKGVGSAIGSVFGPLGGMVGGALGSVVGNLFGGARDAQRLRAFQEQSEKNTMRSAFAAGADAIQSQNAAFMKEGGWVSHDWQPQVITQFGEHKVSDLLKADPMMNTLRAGGHLKEYTPPSERAMYTGRDLPYQMEDGGYMAMGGALKTHWGGEAEHMSYNPYIPGGGETVMFRGQSHDETNGKGQSGIGITYGDNPVEVERGEPMTEMADGGVVFGNMKINKLAANEIGDPKAKGKKFKNYVADLSKTETKQNKILDKASKLALDASENTPFGRLALNSSQASIIGANMKLKDIAQKKQDAAAVQSAILDTADEMGLVSDELAQGKLKQAKFGGKMTAQNGSVLELLKKDGQKTDKASRAQLAESLGVVKKAKDYTGSAKQNTALYKAYTNKKALAATTTNPTSPYAISDGFASGYGTNVLGDYTGPVIGGPSVPKFVELTDERGPNYNWATTPEEIAAESAKPTKEKGKGKKDWKLLAQAVMAGVSPLLRPTNQMGLDPDQLMGEYYALANNQLEPVQAQMYRPQLGGVMDISYQDQLNEITAQARAAERLAQNNPEAAANLFAQVAQAKNKVLAEQTRVNMLGRKQVYDENRNLLNDAQLKNLQILDTQYTRQAQAKSNTKAQAQAALNSISDKIAKNKLENRQLGVMENMYKFRFDPQGRAINFNDLQDFNLEGAGGSKSSTGAIEAGGKKLLPIDYDKAGNPTKWKAIDSDKNGGKHKAKNGYIVKALKKI